MTAVLLLWVAACTDEPGVGVKGERDGNKPVMICAATGGRFGGNPKPYDAFHISLVSGRGDGQCEMCVR